jgi:hypothetical protein
LFCTLLERLIHLFKAPTGVSIKATRTDRNEYSRENVVLVLLGIRYG